MDINVALRCSTSVLFYAATAGYFCDLNGRMVG